MTIGVKHIFVCLNMKVIVTYSSPILCDSQKPPTRLQSMEFSRQEYWSALPHPLRETFPIRGLNLGLRHCRWTLYYLMHQGSPLAIQVSPSEKYILIQFAWFSIGLFIFWGFSGGSSGKESTCQCSRLKRSGFYHWVGKIPWSSKWHPTPVFLLGKFHGQRSLVGPWGPKELDATE